MNNFTFNGNHYLQVKRCARGTKCAMSYANLCIGKFEKKYIYNRIKNKSKLYLKFIVDIFMVWTASKEDCIIYTRYIWYATRATIFISYISYVSACSYSVKNIYTWSKDTSLLYVYSNLYSTQRWYIPVQCPPSVKIISTKTNSLKVASLVVMINLM